MNHQEIGQIGYHEISKHLIKNGYTVVEPDIDKGIDLVAIKNGEVYLIQIKTAIFAEDDKFKTVTASGTKNGLFCDRYSGKNLIIICLDSELDSMYNVCFPRDDLPMVQSLKLRRNKRNLGKYHRYVDNLDALIV